MNEKDTPAEAGNSGQAPNVFKFKTYLVAGMAAGVLVLSAVLFIQREAVSPATAANDPMVHPALADSGAATLAIAEQDKQQAESMAFVPQKHTPTAASLKHDSSVRSVFANMSELGYIDENSDPISQHPVAILGYTPIKPPDEERFDITWKIGVAELGGAFRIWIGDEATIPTKDLWLKAANEWWRCTQSLPSDFRLSMANIIDEASVITLADCRGEGLSNRRVPAGYTCTLRSHNDSDTYHLVLIRNIENYKMEVDIQTLPEFNENELSGVERTVLTISAEFQLGPS